MLIKKNNSSDPRPSEITPEAVYRSRRAFMQQGLGAIAGLAVAGCAQADDPQPRQDIPGPKIKPAPSSAGYDPGEPLTSYEDITSYNNFYEFGTGKSDPAANAHRLKTEPWSVRVTGACEKPGTVNLEDWLKPARLEERIFRLRCVEAWSMVVPWVGFSLASVLKDFAPTSAARYVAFETLLDPKQMPGQRRPSLPWPYREGLRMDEAMHPLATFAVGLYGRWLPNQNGAPLRLVVPWKYGFKSIKSIVGIHFMESEPSTTWNRLAPQEYGFYANVNPQVSHPRWSQARERRIGDLFKRETLMFNGYPEVASLYAGMDLSKQF